MWERLNNEYEWRQYCENNNLSQYHPDNIPEEYPCVIVHVTNSHHSDYVSFIYRKDLK